MHVLITGAGGFVGTSLCQSIREAGINWEITGFDNLGRRGSELNRAELAHLGVSLVHGDIRCASDVEMLPAVDWIIDCAANPSVLAGADGRTSSRQLMEHNLLGTINLLEKCRAHRAGFILLSTSRVYSIPPLVELPVVEVAGAFCPSPDLPLPIGITLRGVNEGFTTASPVSLYGASKLASEVLALEYGTTFDFPVWIDRCGVLAGAGQFGRPDQGIFTYWLNAHLRRRPLRYLGFGGHGYQVRDCLHPRDLVPLLQQQLSSRPSTGKSKILNVSGGIVSARSLMQLTAWCDDRFGPCPVIADGTPRPFDLPWVVLDHARASEEWDWRPQTTVEQILDEIANHAALHPRWLETTGA
jgi:CDP-paratose 2-epimerase